MTGRRFAVVVALVALMVGVGSFAVGVAVFDDGQPDPAPQRGPSSGAVDSTVTAPPTTVAPPPTTGGVTEGAIATPTWIAIVASERSEAEARAEAEAVAGKGYPVGVLQSDEYPSLKAGLWVAYVGPYPTRAEADAAVEALEDDGVDGAYVRCAGTDKECKRDD